MSLENHPNFHVVKFVTDIMVSYHACIRGNAKKMGVNMSNKICRELANFVDNVEEDVDQEVNDNTKKEE